MNLIEFAIWKIDPAKTQDPVTIKSDDTDVVDIIGKDFVGRKEAALASRLLKAAQSRRQCDRREGEVLSIALSPARLVVPVDDTIEPRVMRIKTTSGDQPKIRRRMHSSARNPPCRRPIRLDDDGLHRHFAHRSENAGDAHATTRQPAIA